MSKTYFSDCEEIIAAVKKYLEASNKGGASIMMPVFHKDAVIFWAVLTRMNMGMKSRAFSTSSMRSVLTLTTTRPTILTCSTAW
ncbi:MAG TPA: hypothetical protein IAC82_00800 [Candidatus Merdivicinus intestinigallinarum]|nr:hypothetical protein [Candidatus Merdivicinus intestinigallinarum]